MLKTVQVNLPIDVSMGELKKSFEEQNITTGKITLFKRSIPLSSMKEIARSTEVPLKGILGYTEDKVVPTDFIGSRHSSILDTKSYIAIVQLDVKNPILDIPNIKINGEDIEVQSSFAEY